MKLILYDKQYKNELEELLYAFSDEVFNSKLADIDKFINGHWAIYLAIHNDKVVGFSSFMLNEYYGFIEPVLGNSYLYVKPEHRSSKAMYLFSMQSAKICIENNMSLEHYYSSEDSFKLSSKLNGVKMYTTYLYSVDEVSRIFDKFKSKIKIKD